MPLKNHIYMKNGYTTQYINYPPVAESVNWTLSLNMATVIMIVSNEGQVFKVAFKENLTTLFDYATQMSITTDALVFYVSLSSQNVQEFLSDNAVNYTGACFAYPVTQKVTIDDAIKCVLTDIVNINMFHMMANSMMMENDSMVVDDMNTDIDWNDFMDIDLMDFMDFGVM